MSDKATFQPTIVRRPWTGSWVFRFNVESLSTSSFIELFGIKVSVTEAFTEYQAKVWINIGKEQPESLYPPGLNVWLKAQVSQVMAMYTPGVFVI